MNSIAPISPEARTALEESGDAAEAVAEMARLGRSPQALDGPAALLKRLGVSHVQPAPDHCGIND